MANMPPTLTAQAGDRKAVLTWNNVNANKYVIQKGPDWIVLARVETLSYTVNNLTNGVTYTFRVKAKFPHGDSKNSNIVTVVPTPPINPIPASAPVLSGTAGDTTVTLTWTAVDGATQYRLARQTEDTGFGDGILLSALSGTFTNVTNGTKYSYRVAAVNSYGQGPWSNIVVLTPGVDGGGGGDTADGTTTAGAFGIALLPVRAGMKVLKYTNFEDETRTLGQGFGPKLLEIWRPRPDVERDGQYKDSSGRGTYSVKNTFEQNNSLARFFVHSSNSGDNPLVHNPNGKIHWVYAPLDQQNDLSEMFVQFTVKFPLIAGRKMAHLNWAFGTEVNGEIDIPEGKLDGGSDKGNMFIHHYNSTQQTSIQLHLNLQEAHHFGLYFRRKGYLSSTDPGEIIGYVDGEVVTAPGQTAVGIPNPMHWVGQFETYLKGQDIPGWDSEDNTFHGTAGSGWAEYDKYRIDGPI